MWHLLSLGRHTKQIKTREGTTERDKTQHNHKETLFTGYTQPLLKLVQALQGSLQSERGALHAILHRSGTLFINRKTARQMAPHIAKGLYRPNK